MNMKGIIFICSSLIVLMSNNYDCKERLKNVQSLDSLRGESKWLAYMLNYEHQAYSVATDTIFDSILNCDVVIGEIKQGQKNDTIYFTFHFYKDTKENYYIPKEGYIEAVGYSSMTGSVFPKHSAIGFSPPSNVYFWKSYFEKHEAAFIDFIKKYNGTTSITLKAELKRKSIIK